MSRAREANNFERGLLQEFPRFAVWMAVGTGAALYEGVSVTHYAGMVAVYTAFYAFSGWLRGRP